MRTRRFSPSFDMMEVRMTPTGGGSTAGVAVISSSSADDQGLDFTGGNLITNVPVTTSGSDGPQLYYNGNQDGLDFSGNTLITDVPICS